jgi:hypothetical protein
MSAAATRWISPFWGTVWTEKDPEGGGPAPEMLARAQIVVLNLGKKDEVIVNWFHDALGGPSLAQHSEQVLDVLDAGQFESPQNHWGWLRISSSSPFVPWGVTPAFPSEGATGSAGVQVPSSSSKDDLLWVNMSFFPEDPIDIPDLGPLP